MQTAVGGRGRGRHLTYPYKRVQWKMALGAIRARRGGNAPATFPPFFNQKRAEGHAVLPGTCTIRPAWLKNAIWRGPPRLLPPASRPRPSTRRDRGAWRQWAGALQPPSSRTRRTRAAGRGAGTRALLKGGGRAAGMPTAPNVCRTAPVLGSPISASVEPKQQRWHDPRPDRFLHRGGAFARRQLTELLGPANARVQFKSIS